jgi:hypothetical protein
MNRIAVLLALALPATSACSTFALKYNQCPAYPVSVRSETVSGAVKVQYLGSGGYMVRRDEDVVLFGPVYSNPGLTEIGFNFTIRTDRALVDLLLPEDAKTKTDAIVIGHAHYDHAMDTPYIASAYAKTAPVYGSATLKNLLHSELPNRVFDVKQYLDNQTPEERFVMIGNSMRLWPIASQHSDQQRLKIPLSGINLPVHQWRGEVTKPMSQPPATVSEWAEGETYAYVLDFLDANQNVEFRIYYQDSGTDEPRGFPPAYLPARPGRPGKGIDVALICVGGDFERLQDHPDDIILATNPRFLVLGHWENFFEPQTDICRTRTLDAIPLLKVYDFLDEASEALKEANNKGKPILACPTASVFHFPKAASDDGVVQNAIKKQRVTYDCAKALLPKAGR